MLDPLDERLHIPKLDLALWLGVVAICAGAVVGTTRASTRLRTTFETNRKKIEAAEKSLQNASKSQRGGVRANGAIVKQVDSQRTTLSKELLQLWQQLYDRQAKFMVWPAAVKTSQADEAASNPAAEPAPGKKTKSKKSKPKSQANKKTKPNDLSEPTRQAYNEKVVPAEFERIFAKLNPRRAKPAKESTSALFHDQPADFDGLVAWDPKQREAIIARHQLTTGIPSAARVKLVQEDLWIFESLVDAVQSLNRNVNDPLIAPLKQVDTIDVAQWAAVACAESSAAKKSPAKKSPPSEGDSPDDALLDGRYLDAQGQPLKAGAKQPFAEFKQIFVYLKLVIDERRLPDLLAQLANAPLAVEVRRVTIQFVPDAASSRGAVTEEQTTASANTSRSAVVGSLSTAETTSLDATVEIGGVIYLYNQPDIKKLGAGAAKLPVKRGFRTPTAAAKLP